jgi:hypothetical protein
MKRIDTHQHLWDCRQFPYAWCAGIPALNKSFLLEDYLLAAEGGGIEKTVFVECNVDAPHIEDLPPLHDIEVTLQLPVKSARLVPQGGVKEQNGIRPFYRVGSCPTSMTSAGIHFRTGGDFPQVALEGTFRPM